MRIHKILPRLIYKIEIVLTKIEIQKREFRKKISAIFFKTIRWSLRFMNSILEYMYAVLGIFFA